MSRDTQAWHLTLDLTAIVASVGCRGSWLMQVKPSLGFTRTNH